MISAQRLFVSSGPAARQDIRNARLGQSPTPATMQVKARGRLTEAAARKPVLRVSAYGGSRDLDFSGGPPFGMPPAGIPVAPPRAPTTRPLFDALAERPHEFVDAVMRAAARLQFLCQTQNRESTRGRQLDARDGAVQELEDIMYLCMLARAYSTDSRLQDVLGRAVRGPPGQRYQFTRKPIQLNNIQLDYILSIPTNTYLWKVTAAAEISSFGALPNRRGAYKVGAVVFTDEMTDNLGDKVDEIRGLPRSKEDLAVTRALSSAFQGVSRETWLRRFVQMDIYKVSKACGIEAQDYCHQEYVSMPRYMAKSAYAAHCGEGYGYGRVEASLRRQARKTRQSPSWLERSQAYLDGGYATWRIESGQPEEVVQSGPAKVALGRHIEELFGPAAKGDSSDILLTSQQDYLHMVTEAERVGKALSEAEDLLSCYVDLPENEAKQKFVSAFRKQ